MGVVAVVRRALASFIQPLEYILHAVYIEEQHMQTTGFTLSHADEEGA